MAHEKEPLALTLKAKLWYLAARQAIGKRWQPPTYRVPNIRSLTVGEVACRFEADIFNGAATLRPEMRSAALRLAALYRDRNAAISGSSWSRAG